MHGTKDIFTGVLDSEFVIDSGYTNLQDLLVSQEEFESRCPAVLPASLPPARPPPSATGNVPPPVAKGDCRHRLPGPISVQRLRTGQECRVLNTRSLPLSTPHSSIILPQTSTTPPTKPLCRPTKTSPDPVTRQSPHLLLRSPRCPTPQENRSSVA